MMSCQSSAILLRGGQSGTRHRSRTCGKSKHLVRPRHSKQGVEVCCPCGVEQAPQVGESLAGAGERERRGFISSGKDTHRQTDRKSLAGLATYRTGRSTGGNRKTRRETRSLQHGRAASQAWSPGGSCSSRASRMQLVIACDAADERHVLALCGPASAESVWTRDVLTVVCPNQIICSPQPHPGSAARMGEERALTRRSQ